MSVVDALIVMTLLFHGLAEELDSDAVLPLSLLLLLLLRIVLHPHTMHLVVLEAAHIGPSIGFLEGTDTLLHAIHKVTMIVTTISELLLALSIGLTVFKVAFVEIFSLSNELAATTMENVVLHFTFVIAAIGPLKAALTNLLSILVRALKSDSAALPFFSTDSMLLVI